MKPNAMPPLYPLRFTPIFRRYVWGGRKLGTLLDKPLGDGNDYAESWELVDRGEDQSLVADGPLAGTTLGQLRETRGPELFGRHHPQPRFPLLRTGTFFLGLVSRARCRSVAWSN